MSISKGRINSHYEQKIQAINEDNRLLKLKLKEIKEGLDG